MKDTQETIGYCQLSLDLLYKRHSENVFIDLDNSKQPNDKYGHEFGDAALIYVFKVLKMYEEKYHGIASRYGGDEFILVFPNLDKDDSEEVGKKICHDLASTVELKSVYIDIHASVGIALYPLHGLNPDELICKADLALYISNKMVKIVLLFTLMWRVGIQNYKLITCVGLFLYTILLDFGIIKGRK